MFSRIGFLFISVTFIAVFLLKDFWYFSHSFGLGALVFDLFHLVVGLIVSNMIWGLSGKNKRFPYDWGLVLLFLALWLWFTRALPHLKPGGAFVFELTLLTGPLYWAALQTIPQVWNWVFFPLSGMVYWAWLGEAYRHLFFERSKKTPSGHKDYSPDLPELGDGRIAYYRIALVMGFLVAAGTLVLHICLWRIPGLPAPPFEGMEAASILLFFGLWLPFFIKQGKDKGIWRKLKINRTGFLDRFYQVAKVYSIGCFIVVFATCIFMVSTHRWDNQKFATPKNTTGWTPESFEGRFFMLGWTAFLMFGAFSSARDTYFQIRYLQNKEDPEAHPLPAPESEAPAGITNAGEAALMVRDLMDRRGDVELQVLPSLKLKAPGVILPSLMMVLFPMIPAFVVSGKGQPGMGWFLFGVAGLAGFAILATVLPTACYIYFAKPAVILSPRGLWMCELGWMPWEEIEGLRVVPLGAEKTIGIIPKDWAWTRRVKWHYLFKAWWNRQFFGYLTSFPFAGLTVTGEDFMRYASEKQKVPILKGQRAPYEDIVGGER